MVLYILSIILFWALCEAMECNQICLQNSSTDFYNTPATFHFVPSVPPFKVYRLLTITDKYTKGNTLFSWPSRPPGCRSEAFPAPQKPRRASDITLSNADWNHFLSDHVPYGLEPNMAPQTVGRVGVIMGHHGSSWTDNCVCPVCVCYCACVGGGKWPEATSQGGEGLGNGTPWPLLNTPL